MAKTEYAIKLALVGLAVAVVSQNASGAALFAPPHAFYTFPSWVFYPYYKPPWNNNNFTNASYSTGWSSNYTGWNNTFRGDPKYYYTPYYNGYNHSVQYGSNLFVGYIWPMDRLLFNQSFSKSPRWWSSREKIVEYPGPIPYGHVRNETITCVRIYDHYLNGQSGSAGIIAGGVGNRYVKIRLASSGINRGFNFMVQIFGH